MPPDPSFLAPALASLPPFTTAWAYGSSIFAQPSLTPSSRGGPRLSQPAQLDVIVAVADTTAWHAANLASNPAHYTPLARWVGSGGVATLASHVGVGVWFNQGCDLPPGASTPLAPGLPPPSALKYGVVQVSDLVADLTEWRHLYLAGRLHKPTVEVRGTESAAADTTTALPPALATNAAAATAAALLLLPPVFDDAAWRGAVVGLSYGGDVRHTINADGVAKPARIAAGSAAGLDALYVPHLVGGVGQAGGVHRLATSWVQDPRPRARGALLAWLPARLRGRLAVAAGLPPHAAPTDVAAVLAARGPRGTPPGRALAAAVSSSLARVVRASSARQAVLGLLSAGPVGAARYVGAKLSKRRGG